MELEGSLTDFDNRANQPDRTGRTLQPHSIKKDESIDEHLEIVEDMANELMAACFGVDTPEGVDRDARAVFIAAQRHIRRR